MGMEGAHSWDSLGFVFLKILQNLCSTKKKVKEKGVEMGCACLGQGGLSARGHDLEFDFAHNKIKKSGASYFLFHFLDFMKVQNGDSEDWVVKFLTFSTCYCKPL